MVFPSGTGSVSLVLSREQETYWSLAVLYRCERKKFRFLANCATVSHQTAPIVTHYTTGDSTYRNWAPVYGDNRVEFTAHACSNAFISLAQIMFESRSLAYEVALGINDNTRSEIRDEVGGESKVSHDGAVLNCDEPQKFWIRWGRDTDGIQVGRGDGDTPFMSWDNPTLHDINAIGLGSSQVDAAFNFHYDTSK